MQSYCRQEVCKVFTLHFRYKLFCPFLEVQVGTYSMLHHLCEIHLVRFLFLLNNESNKTKSTYPTPHLS